MPVHTHLVPTPDPDLLGGGGTGRRLTPPELDRLVRRRHGVTLVGGLARHLAAGGRGMVPARPVWGAGQVAETRRIDASGPAHLEWISEPVPADVPSGGVVLCLDLATGNGSPFPQPSASFALVVDGNQVCRLTHAKRPRRWTTPRARLLYDVRLVQTASTPGESFDLDDQVRHECSAASGLALLHLPRSAVRPGAPVTLRLTPHAPWPSAEWARVGRTLDLVDAAAVGRLLADEARPRFGDRTVLFGDIHNHSGQSLLRADLLGLAPGEEAGCGSGSAQELFGYARDVAGLDFFCLSEHDWQMDERDWAALGDLTDRFGTADFVTLHGFEWTSAAYGHRNVYFRDRPGPLLRSGDPRRVNAIEDDAPTPRQLWAHLDAGGTPAITVPHHMSVRQFPLSLDRFHDPRYDRVAEVYSAWGDSLEHAPELTLGAARVPELALLESIRAGHRIGFVASSDSHDGSPGRSQGTDVHTHLFHFLGSGITGVLVPEPGRAAVFDALQQRRCYAATGENVAVDCALEGHPLGSEVSAARLGRRRRLNVRVSSALPVDEVVVMKDGRPADVLRPSAPGGLLDLDWVDPDVDDTRDASYYVRITRTDGERAWTSPIWVSRRA